MTEATTESRINKLESDTARHAKALDDQRSKTIESNKEARNYVDQQGKLTNLVVGDLSLRVEVLEQPPEAPPEPKAELFTALVAAQTEIKNAAVNVTNEFTNKKYADLASVMNAVREPLAKNGLAIIQLTEDQGPSLLGIRTILVHESGQTIEDVITMAPPKVDPQGIGSCRTYMRRYAVLAMCGIAGAVDDDAEGAMKNPNDYPRISVGEVEKIIYTADELFEDHSDDAVKLMLDKVYTTEERKIANVGDIPEGEAESALKYLNNAKKARDKREAAAKKEEAAAAKAAQEEK